MTTQSFYEIHFTGEGFRTLGVYRLFFKAALQEANQRVADYEAELKDWYENGDGRPVRMVEHSDSDSGVIYHINEGGHGHTFPVCIHGTSLWTDYDNICAGCEEGETPIQYAIVRGREQWLRFNDRWDWVTSAPGDLDNDVRNGLFEWATSLFPKPKP
jgi:hypothetical protein